VSALILYCDDCGLRLAEITCNKEQDRHRYCIPYRHWFKSGMLLCGRCTELRKQYKNDNLEIEAEITRLMAEDEPQETDHA
jgi:hypothetical protein